MRLIPAGLALSVALCGLSAPVWAGESSIWWPGWSISSTEDLHEIDNGEKPLPHPLSALFDSNPKTTWVMNPRATLEEAVIFETGEKLFTKSKRGLIIAGKSQLVSGLQIMNGDNLSRRAFRNGNRIRTLKIILMNGKQRRTYTRGLKDKMGWQRVSWPRGRADKIAIEFVELVNAKKPVSASGLGLLEGAREIKWNMPQAVMFWDGLEGCGASLLLNRRGEVLDGVSNEMGNADEWSQNGRFVAGSGGGPNENYIWVADVQRGQIIKKIFAPHKAKEAEAQYKWLGPHQFRIQWTRPDEKGNWKPFRTKIYRF